MRRKQSVIIHQQRALTRISLADDEDDVLFVRIRSLLAAAAPPSEVCTVFVRGSYNWSVVICNCPILRLGDARTTRRRRQTGRIVGVTVQAGTLPLITPLLSTAPYDIFYRVRSRARNEIGTAMIGAIIPSISADNTTRNVDWH